MPRKLSKQLTNDVCLAQVSELPNLYHIRNLDRDWEAWWRVLLAFNGPDFGVIIAGKLEVRGFAAAAEHWAYVTRDDDVYPPCVCWKHEFSDTEAEYPYVYTSLKKLCRDLVQLSEEPVCMRFRPMFWIRSEEGWRVPMQRLLARGVRLYSAAEVEQERALREEQLRWWRENLGPGGTEQP